MYYYLIREDNTVVAKSTVEWAHIPGKRIVASANDYRPEDVILDPHTGELVPRALRLRDVAETVPPRDLVKLSRDALRGGDVEGALRFLQEAVYRLT